MEFKGTPGPWKVRNARAINLEYFDGRVVKEGVEIDILHDLTNEHITTIKKVAKFKELAEANAALIAAAPLLLAEMLRYLPIIQHLENEPELWHGATQGTGVATSNGYRNAITAALGTNQ